MTESRRVLNSALSYPKSMYILFTGPAKQIRVMTCQIRNSMSDLVAYVDGSSHGNPGRSGIGVVIESPGGEKTRIAKSIGHHDNNVAEYVALLEALQHAIAVNAGRLHVHSDSEIVVKQMTGEYACRSSSAFPELD